MKNFRTELRSLALATSLLAVGFPIACGGSGGGSPEEVMASSKQSVEETRAGAPSGDECPISESPDTTYDPGELPLKFTFQYPGSWEVTNETTLKGGMARLTMRRAFEFNGNRRSLALELVQNGRTSTQNAIDQMTRSKGEFLNQEQKNITLGDETVHVGQTLTGSKVMYTLGVPGDGGYHLTQLHMQWARGADDLCKDEVLRLGSEMLDTFALR